MFKTSVAAGAAVLAIVALPGHAAAGGPYGFQGPVYDWTGVYVGGNAGYSWGDGKLSDIAVNGMSIPDPDSRAFDGALGGGQIGFNYAFGGGGVLGIEVDMQAAGNSFSETQAGPILNSDLEWLSTFRARAGYAKDSIMVYATAGAALGRNTLSLEEGGQSVSKKHTHSGWTVGGGIEGKEGKVSTKLEYLYVDLGDETYTLTLPGTSVGASAKADFHILRAGVNYHF